MAASSSAAAAAAAAGSPKTLTLNSRRASQMPLLGLGTWQAAPGVVGQAVTDALERGRGLQPLDSSYPKSPPAR
jgi:hypothetical protein